MATTATTCKKDGTVLITCSECHGTGKLGAGGQKCVKCRGTGKLCHMHGGDHGNS